MLWQRLRAEARVSMRAKRLSNILAIWKTFYLAERRLKDLRAGRTDTIQLEEMMKRYGVAD
jgi:hypothetical protein